MHPKIEHQLRDLNKRIDALTSMDVSLYAVEAAIQRYHDTLYYEPRASAYVSYEPAIGINVDVSTFKDAVPLLRILAQAGFRIKRNNPFYKDNASGSVYYYLKGNGADVTVYARLKESPSDRSACKRVKVGERTVTYDVYELRCPETALSANFEVPLPE